MDNRLSDYQLVTGELVTYRRRRAGLWEDVPVYLAYSMAPAPGRRLLTMDGEDAGYMPDAVWQALQRLPRVTVHPALTWTEEDEEEARGEALGSPAV